MDVICFRPRADFNLNDTFTEWGVKVLLREVLGDPVYFHNVYFEPLDNDKIPDHDLFVLCGTPWIWDQCTRSPKYADLVTVLSGSEAPKIALGIGACFPFGFNYNKVKHALTSMPGLGNILGSFSSITVRDIYAKKVCDLLGIRADLLCCPAVFAREYYGTDHHEPDKDLLFFYAPQFGLSAGVLNEDFIQHYVMLQANYAYTFGAEAICITRDEARLTSQLGVNAELLQNPEKVAEKITMAKTLLSGRVHGCIFATGMPISAALLPVDTRYLTYQYCGGKVIRTDKVSSITPKKLRRCRFNYSEEKKKWEKFLAFSLESIGLL